MQISNTMFEYSKNEIISLTIAFIVLSISFSISSVRLNAHGFISILPIVMIGVGLGFMLREIGQKFVAMKHGCEAECRAWPIGLLIAFVSSFIGMVFAFPGEVKVYSDNITDELNGRIGIAGPMANMFLALIFIVIASLVYVLTPHSQIFNLMFLICTVGFSVNSFLAAFNLMPVYTLDGIKVLKWSFKIWIVVFAIAVIMMLSSIMIGAENMVMMFVG